MALNLHLYNWLAAFFKALPYYVSVGKLMEKTHYWSKFAEDFEKRIDEGYFVSSYSQSTLPSKSFTVQRIK